MSLPIKFEKSQGNGLIKVTLFYINCLKKTSLTFFILPIDIS